MNPYGTEFTKLYMQYKSYPFFRKAKLDSGVIFEFRAPAGIYNNCYKIAREKAKYTMNYNQNLRVRSGKEKEIKQFKGVLAETAVQLFLVQECGIPFEQVRRWDLERRNFRNAWREYDIKIVTGNKELFIESRASDSYRTSLPEFVKNYDIIGRYSNRSR